MAQRPDGTPAPVLLHALTTEVVAAEHAAEVVVTGGVGGAGAGGFLAALPVDGADDASLHRNRAHLDGLRASGRYRMVDGPVLGVLVLERGGAATGSRGEGRAGVGVGGWPNAGDGVGADAVSRTVAIVGDIDVVAYTDGRVLPHEQVDDDRVRELARYLDVVEAASSPVCVTHRPHPEVTAATETVLSDPPAVSFTTTDGTRSSLHLVSDPTVRQRLVGAVAAAGQLYLADGHHRAAAVARCQADRGDGVRVLTAVVPADHLHVAAFHRRIDGPGVASTPGRAHEPLPAGVPESATGSSPASGEVRSLLRSLGLQSTPLAGPSTPDAAGIVHVVVDGSWWRVDLRDLRVPGTVPELDATLVDRELVGPLQVLAGPDSTVRTSPAPAGLEPLDVPGAVGLALHPPALDDVLHAAERGAVLPPKTTYLAPKLPAGLLVVPRPRSTTGHP